MLVVLNYDENKVEYNVRLPDLIIRKKIMHK